jgi:DNA mismatch endonuclease (patch repair protein)
MADVHEPEVRSYNMSQIKGKNTKPEILVRKFLHHNGYRYSLHSKKLPGKPDIVLKKYKTVILVNGCFWHGHHNCKYFVLPKTRTIWWKEKIEKTQKNDQDNREKLINQGWKVIEIWECQLKPSKLNVTLNALLNQIENTLQ